MRLKMTMKHKAMAYLLNKDMRYSMKKIAQLMDLSPSTISKGIKEFEYEKMIYDLRNELENAKRELMALGYTSNTSNILPPVNKQEGFIDGKYNELNQ